MPPVAVRQAMELQAEAERRKRADILASEGQRQSKVRAMQLLPTMRTQQQQLAQAHSALPCRSMWPRRASPRSSWRQRPHARTRSTAPRARLAGEGEGWRSVAEAWNKPLCLPTARQLKPPHTPLFSTCCLPQSAEGTGHLSRH